MGKEKVILLLCVIFSSLQFSETTRRQYLKSKNIRTIIHHPDERNNCICFQGSEKLTLVPNLLNSRNHGYERLLVYFYKDRVTQEIKMYTPSADKQYIIPDLPFEVGDSLLTITHTDTVNNVINMSPHRIVQNITHDVNIQDTNVDHVNEPVTVSIGGDEPVTAAPIGMNTGPIETRPLVDLLPQIVNHPDQDNDINIVVQPDDGHYHEPEGNNAPGHLTPGNIDPFDSVNVDVQTDNPNSWQAQDVNHESNWNEYNNIYNKYNSTSIFDQYVSMHDDGYLTFDKWFQQQLERFHSMQEQESFDAIDVETLRILIQQMLQKNNIFISTDGILTDSQGTIIDVSNLKLRPVFIGNTLEYENFLKASGSKFLLPTNMPYLEALVVSLKHPPKMLGIIPMGKTFIPQLGGTVSNTQMKKWGPTQHVAPSVTKTHCVNGKCKIEPISRSLPYGRSSGRRIIPGFLNTQPIMRPAYIPIQHRRDSWRRYPIAEKNMKHLLNKEVEPIIIDLKSFEREKETRRFPDVPFGNLFKQVFKVLLDNSRRGYDEPEVSERQDGEDNSLEEDRPDFRIIGGIPATSSGTPVSSRGRSGITKF